MGSRDTAAGRVTVDELREIRNAPVYTAEGDEFGHVGEIWYDEDTREARYLKVGRGALGLRAVCVPVQGGTVRDDGFQVPYGRDQLESSPEFGEDEDWTEEREFASYYGGRDVGVSDADAPIARSQDEVGPGQARLRKYAEGDTS